MTDLPIPERSTRARERSPETSDQTALLAALQRGIPSNVADKVLLAVFKHLQPRVSCISGEPAALLWLWQES